MSKKRTPLLLLGVALLISFLLDPTPDRLPTLALIAAIGGTAILPRTKTQRVVGVFICCALLIFSLSSSVGTMMIKDIADEPSQHWLAPNAQVRLGGQTITFDLVDSTREGYHILTACYWLDNSTTLIAAHKMKKFTPGEALAIQVTGDGYIENFETEVIFNNDDGLALGLTSEFIPPADLYSIAASKEIIVGAEAEIISQYGGSFPVIVKGFFALRGRDEIAIEIVNDEDDLIGGMSGSPVVQNGKIIGFMRGGFKSARRIGLCKIAAKIYANAADLMQEYTP